MVCKTHQQTLAVIIIPLLPKHIYNFFSHDANFSPKAQETAITSGYYLWQDSR